MANNENLIPIPGRLHSVATEGHVAGANEIYDDTLAKDQATINSEVNTALGTGGTVDSRIAAAKAEIIGGASTDYNTLGKVENKLENIDGNIAYIDDSSSSPAVVPSFDPESQTVHVTAQTLSEQQKAQVRDNIGLGDVDAKINEAVASEASQRSAADSALSSGKADKATTLSGYGITDAYTKSETYSKTEVNNLVTTPNQEYVSVTATSQTTAVTDVLPATGATDTTYRIGNWDGTQYNDSVFSEYAWNGTAYIKLSTKSQVGEVYDISANHADTKYADLAAALGTNGANIPQNLRKGGMSVKYVQSSDNKYVQFRYNGTAVTGNPNPFLNVANWQEYGKDEDLKQESTFLQAQISTSTLQISGSDLVFGKALDGDGYSPFDSANRAYTKNFIICKSAPDIRFNLGSYTGTVYFYDKDKNFISRNTWFETFENVQTPNEAEFFRLAVDAGSAITSANYMPVSYTLLIEDLFCDIKDLATILTGKAITPSTGALETNANFTSFVVPNFGFKQVASDVAFVTNSNAAFAFYSEEIISTSYFIGMGKSLTGSGETKKLVCDVPSNCKLIVFGARTASNPSVSIFGAKSDKIVEKQLLSILNRVYNEGVLLNELKYGYFDIETGLQLTEPDGVTVSCSRYYEIHPKDTIRINNPSGYNIANYWYNKDKQLISVSWFGSKSELYAPNEAYYVRFAFRSTTILNFSDFSIHIIKSGKIGDFLRLEIRDLANGYVNDNGIDILASDQRVCYTPFIAVNEGKDYKVTSDEISTMMVFCYDKNFTPLYYLNWFGTNKNFYIPEGVFYIRLSFGQGISTSSLENDIILASDEAKTLSIIQAKNLNPFANRFDIGHLFIEESIDGVNVKVPSQSLFDIEIAARLGFSMVELNIHTTSDGKYICIHGASGKFGNQVQHIDGETDLSNVAIGSVTLDYIKQYVRYKSIYPKYRTTIPTLQEACICAKKVGISVDASFTGVSVNNFPDVIGIIRGYFGENFVVGSYGDSNARTLREIFKGTILNYCDDNTIQSISTICQKVGAPYIHCMSGTALNGLTDLTLKEIVDAVHQQDCYISFADAYTTRAMAARLFDCGFDMAAGCDFSINDFGSGNLCNLSADIDFGDFTHDGTVTDNDLLLESGDTVTPNVSLEQHFLCGGYMQIVFNGTLQFQMGKIDETITSDGSLPIIMSSLFMSQLPTFTITATANTTVSQLIYKANKF